jgi:HD-GYP domain-containing protein (c-di-GMP phosphodiesterase class II)
LPQQLSDKSEEPDRRRDEDTQDSRTAPSWDALLAIDQLARRLTFHKDPSRNQQRILDAAVSLLPVQALLWISCRRDQSVLLAGQVDLPPEECRRLAELLGRSSDFRPPAPLLLNDWAASTSGSRFPAINNLLAFQVGKSESQGWFVALNKRAESSFRRSDAALLLPFAALLELHLRWSQRYQDMRDLLAGLTRSLTAALDAKDTYAVGHSERVARIAVELGRELGLAGDELSDIYLAGLLHDVGKIGIQDSILHKEDALTPEEMAHIQEHVAIGYGILADLRPIRKLLPGVLYHHEHYDGTGYPDGLAGADIPLLARILAVADAYDAMSHARAYRDSLPFQRVEEVLQQGAGAQWDKQVVDAFMRCRHRIYAIQQRGLGDSLRQAIDGALRSDTESQQARSALVQARHDE